MTAGIRAGASNDGYLQVNGVDVVKLEAGGAVTALLGPIKQPLVPAFKAYRNLTQSIPDSVQTKVGFDTKTLDTTNAFNTTTNRFQPLVAGWYRVNTFVSVGGASISNTQLTLYKNGVAEARVAFLIAPAGGVGLSGSALIFLNGSTDYLEVFVIIVAASGHVVSAGAPNSEFSATLAVPT